MQTVSRECHFVVTACFYLFYQYQSVVDSRPLVQRLAVHRHEENRSDNGGKNEDSCKKSRHPAMRGPRIPLHASRRRYPRRWFRSTPRSESATLLGACPSLAGRRRKIPHGEHP